MIHQPERHPTGLACTILAVWIRIYNEEFCFSAVCRFYDVLASLNRFLVVLALGMTDPGVDAAGSDWLVGWFGGCLLALNVGFDCWFDSWLVS